jgi:hypothetical protein
MKYLYWLSLPVAFCVALSFLPAAEEGKQCPISGKPAKDGISLVVNGETIGFCCDGCPKAYQKKINLVKDDGPNNCPLSGKLGKAEHSTIETTAEMVYFCCNSCPKGLAKKNGFEIKDEGPKKCPISGNPAKSADGTSLVVNGETMYFCCANCPKAYLKKLGVAKTDVGDCPLTGKPGKEETGQIVVTSKNVYFCCGNCPKAYAKKRYQDGKIIPAEAKVEEAKKKAKL